jgi:hypothetical protein
MSNFVKISDISQDDFTKMRTHFLPNIPFNNSFIMIQNHDELLFWKEKFITRYGDGGRVHFEKRKNLIKDNEKYDLDVEKCYRKVKGYFKKIYTGKC